MTKKTVRDDDLNELERLSAEVARLREAFDISSGAHAQAEAVLAAERAAHEATKAELAAAHESNEGLCDELDKTDEHYTGIIAELKARVAELERAHEATKAALDQARGLLATKRDDQGRDWNVRRIEWLRDHPATEEVKKK